MIRAARADCERFSRARASGVSATPLRRARMGCRDADEKFVARVENVPTGAAAGADGRGFSLSSGCVPAVGRRDDEVCGWWRVRCVATASVADDADRVHGPDLRIHPGGRACSRSSGRSRRDVDPLSRLDCEPERRIAQPFFLRTERRGRDVHLITRSERWKVLGGLVGEEGVLYCYQTRSRRLVASWQFAPVSESATIFKAHAV